MKMTKLDIEMQPRIEKMFLDNSPYPWLLKETDTIEGTPRKYILHYKGLKRLTENTVLYLFGVNVPYDNNINTVEDFNKLFILTDFFEIDLTTERFKKAGIVAVKALLKAAGDEAGGVRGGRQKTDDQWEEYVDDIIVICDKFQIDLKNELFEDVKTALLFLMSEGNDNPDAAIKLINYTKVTINDLGGLEGPIMQVFAETIRRKLDFIGAFCFQLSDIIEIVEAIDLKSFEGLDIPYSSFEEYLDYTSYSYKEIIDKYNALFRV